MDQRPEITAQGLHPRPQMVRANWTDLCGEWGFAHDDADRGLGDGWQDGDGTPFDRRIIVPFPPESGMSGIAERGFHPVIWYRKVLPAQRPGPEECLLLHFGAVDYKATVWLNGRCLGEHEGGHSPFAFDITSALAADGSLDMLVLRVEDRSDDPFQPRGKQDWQQDPHRIWYHRTSGIWQPVWLESVPALHIADLGWTPRIHDAMVDLAVDLSAASTRAVRLRVELTHDGETLVDTQVSLRGQTSQLSFAVPALLQGMDRDRLLWSPERPTLIDARLTLEDEGAQVLDQVDSYLGLRSASVGGETFLLNGRPCYLRLVLGQNYWPDSHLAAPSVDALREEVELTRSLGFNGIRIHQKAEDPRFLYWCDRLGLLVWGEMANAYAFSPGAVERMTREWMDLVRRDRSHPCVVTWVPINESWGVPDIATRPEQRSYASALYHLTRSLDPSRPVISNDGWEHTESDIWSVHDYSTDGDSIRQRYADGDALEKVLSVMGPQRRRILLDPTPRKGQPVVLSEVGGLSFSPREGEDWFGYATVSTPDEFLTLFTDIIGAILDSPTVAGFCYTQLTDTEQETNGLLTADRKPKIDPEQVRAVIERASAMVPAEKIDAFRRKAQDAR